MSTEKIFGLSAISCTPCQSCAFSYPDETRQSERLAELHYQNTTGT